MASRIKNRLIVAGVFLRAAILHSAIPCVPYVIFLINPSFLFDQPIVGRAARIWLPANLVVCGIVHFNVYKDVVGKYLDLTSIPVALARREIKQHYNYLWPQTALLTAGAFVNGFLMSLTGGDIGSGMLVLFWTCVLPLGMAAAGAGIQWVLLRLFAPSRHERLVELSEAMEAGVKSTKPSVRPAEQPGSEPLPFDRPPV